MRAPLKSIRYALFCYRLFVFCCCGPNIRWQHEYALWEDYIGVYVKTVDLSNSDVSDDELQLLAGVCPHVTEINLSQTRTTPSAVATLCAGCRELQWIDLSAPRRTIRRLVRCVRCRRCTSMWWHGCERQRRELLCRRILRSTSNAERRQCGVSACLLRTVMAGQVI